MLVTVIVSVYKDANALQCLLYGFERQTINDFEVIVAEDGDSTEISGYLINYVTNKYSIVHLTQEDKGFRKTMAVNRAIAMSKGEYLVFLDGDCIPHNNFIENHVKNAGEGYYCAGRKMHLGKRWSAAVRLNPSEISKIQTWASLFKNIWGLHKDHVRNFEIGAPSRVFHEIFKEKKLSLVGCNFSIFKSDILLVNGYDEDLPGIGGEDDDLGTRLEALNVKSRNVKFKSICYHLHHESRRVDWDLNKKISQEKHMRAEYFARNGVDGHYSEFKINND